MGTWLQRTAEWYYQINYTEQGFNLAADSWLAVPEEFSWQCD